MILPITSFSPGGEADFHSGDANDVQGAVIHDCEYHLPIQAFSVGSQCVAGGADLQSAVVGKTKVSGDSIGSRETMRMRTRTYPLRIARNAWPEEPRMCQTHEKASHSNTAMCIRVFVDYVAL